VNKDNAFECVDCGYQGTVFSIAAGPPSSGALTYQARCPKCGSCMVNALPGFKEENLVIFASKEIAWT
jgi:ribosomal protein S27E